MMKNKKERSSRKETECSVCKKVVVGSSYKLRAHMYQHKAVPARFQCSLCAKEFFRSDVYTKHMAQHSGATKKMYVCDHCDRSFVNKRNLLLHLHVHDDTLGFKYTCVACGITYCEERLLKYHIRKTHYNLHNENHSHFKKELNETWIEPVKESKVCVEMTKVNNNMLSIKKCDTFKQEKEDKIEVVDEKTKFKDYISSVFAQKDKSQYSKAMCDYCNKEMLKKSLLSHIRERHLKLRRFKCDECSRSFSRHYQLVDHDCGKARRRRQTEK